MSVPNKAGIKRRFGEYPANFRDYFEHFPKLLDEFPWDVSMSYIFARIEQAQNMAIYAGVVKLHKVDSVLARKAVDSRHMTREGFRDLYKTIYGRKIPDDVLKLCKEAEEVRDRILHGKTVNEEDKRKAVCAALEYASRLNERTNEIAGLRPFGSMKGFKGRATALDRSTSRWVLIGTGLLSAPDPKGNPASKP